MENKGELIQTLVYLQPINRCKFKHEIFRLIPTEIGKEETALYILFEVD